MLFDPMYFAKQALWFWSTVLNGMIADFESLAPPKPVLSVVPGGRK